MQRRSQFILVFLSGVAGLIFAATMHGQAPNQPAPGGQIIQAVPPPATLQPPPAALQLPGAPGAPVPALDNFLVFDKEQRDVAVTNGSTEAYFTFSLTNISSGDVIINFVQTSCGCTVAKLPSQPWTLKPQEHGEISATMQLAGTPAGASKTKTLTVNSDHGSKVLYAKATILPDPVSMTVTDRTNNLNMAKADRQAVFKGDCIRCHVTPAKTSLGVDKMGQDLYTAVCSVCHEAEHQASFVPNLHKLTEPTSPEFWRNWIMHGKPGSLMPAFDQSEGGNLSKDQIESLVMFLSVTIPSHPAVLAAPAGLKVQ